MNRKHILYMLLATGFVLMAQSASASTTGSLPWETPMQTIRTSITGPVALSVALIAICASGAMLIFGGEISQFTRTGVYIVLVLGLLVAANNFLSALYTTGATIPEKYRTAEVSQPYTVEQVHERG